LAASFILTIALIRKIFSKELFIPISIAMTVTMIFFLYINPSFIQNRLAIRNQKSLSEGFLQRRLESAVLYPMRNLTGLKILYGTGSVYSHMNEEPLVRDPWRSYVEVHNMFGHVLWVYGIIGLLLYLPWIVKSVWEDHILKDGLFVWAAFLAFSIGGVLVRSRMFWIIQGLMLALVLLKLQTRKKLYSSDPAAELRQEHQLPSREVG
jgi:hypothetical protein